jgi:hypothetical protein
MHLYALRCHSSTKRGPLAQLLDLGPEPADLRLEFQHTADHGQVEATG